MLRHSMIRHHHMICLVMLVFAGCSSSSIVLKPTATATASIPQTFVPIMPTPTTTPLVSPTPTMPASYTVQPVMKINLKYSPLILFPTAVTADKQKFLAYAVQPNMTDPMQAKPISVGWINTANGNYTAITLPGSIPSTTATLPVSIDGSYGIISAYPPINQSTEKETPITDPPLAVWAWNMTSGVTQSIGLAGITAYGDHDLLIVASPTYGLETLNLDTQVVSQISGTSPASDNQLQVLSFTWPYVIYAATPHGSNTMSVHANDLQTGTDISLSSVTSAFNGLVGTFTQTSLAIGNKMPPKYIVGASGTDTVMFIALESGEYTLKELDHVMLSTSQPVVVANLGSSIPGIFGFDAHTILLGGMYASAGMIIDHATQHIYTLGMENGPLFTYAFFNGNLFTLVQFEGGASGMGMGGAPEVPFEADIYSTAQVPSS